MVSRGGAVGLGFEAEAEEGDRDEYSPDKLHDTARPEGDSHRHEEQLATDLEHLPPEDVRFVGLARGEGRCKGQ